jgi:N-terminal domain on NACHT_NTPase and P-loop NTPases
MAEVIAAVAIVSSIVQLVDFGCKVISRLTEFQSSQKDNPKTFGQIETELPLLLHTLNETKEAIDAELVKQGTVKVLLPVIEGCREQVESLDAILMRILPAKGDSRAKRSLKAVSSSFFQEDKVDRISSSLQKYVQFLTLYFAAASSTLKPMIGTSHYIKADLQLLITSARSEIG